MNVQEIFLNAVTDSGEWKNGISSEAVSFLRVEFEKLENEIKELKKCNKKNNIKKAPKRQYKKKVILKKDIKKVGIVDRFKKMLNIK